MFAAPIHGLCIYPPMINKFSFWLSITDECAQIDPKLCHKCYNRCANFNGELTNNNNNNINNNCKTRLC